MNLLTLLEVRKELFSAGNDTVVYADATAAEKGRFDGRLNRVLQAFFERMTPARAYRRIDVPIYDHTITLPRQCEGLLGAVPLTDAGCRCSPLFIYSRFHEFAESGSFTCNARIAQPLTENAQTFRDPAAGFMLRAKGTADEGAAYTLIGGTGTDDKEFFDSVELQIDNGTTTTSRVWNTLPRILKPETDTGVELYSVDSTTEAETLIATHAPGETSPAYQRFSVPNWGDTVNTARVLTRLCYVKLTADTDIVYPSSFRALQYGLQALKYDEVNDTANAEAKWQAAMDIIDKGKQQSEGDAEIPVWRSMPGFGCEGVPNLTPSWFAPTGPYTSW